MVAADDGTELGHPGGAHPVSRPRDRTGRIFQGESPTEPMPMADLLRRNHQRACRGNSANRDSLGDRLGVSRHPVASAATSSALSTSTERENSPSRKSSTTAAVESSAPSAAALSSRCMSAMLARDHSARYTPSAAKDTA